LVVEFVELFLDVLFRLTAWETVLFLVPLFFEEVFEVTFTVLFLTNSC